jgi:uncharacterized Zn-finger protein
VRALWRLPQLLGMAQTVEQEKHKVVQEMKPKIIHTKTFYCDGPEDEFDQHPRVYYTFDNKVDSTDKTDKGYVVCEYCYAEFIYKEKDFYTKMLEEKDLLDMGLKDSIRQKEERTPSQEMQDKLEPIPCPMHEDYDDVETKDDFVNKILKGSG